MEPPRRPWMLLCKPARKGLASCDSIKIFAIILIILGLSRWALNTITYVLIGGRQRDTWHIEKRRKQCNHGGKDWSDATTNQGMPRATTIWGWRETDSPLKPLVGVTLLTSWFCFLKLMLDFWPPELVWENKFCWFRSQVCDNLLWHL